MYGTNEVDSRVCHVPQIELKWLLVVVATEDGGSQKWESLLVIRRKDVGNLDRNQFIIFSKLWLMVVWKCISQFLMTVLVLLNSGMSFFS